MTDFTDAFESLAARYGEEFASNLLAECLDHAPEEEADAFFVEEADRVLRPWAFEPAVDVLDADIPF